MLEYGLDASAAMQVDIMLYIQLLVNSNKTVGTIRNYISGAKLYVAERGRRTESFGHYMVTTFLKGVERHSNRAPCRAVSLPTSVIRRACRALRSFSPGGEIMAAAVLFAYATMLRQCHLFYTLHGHMHLIARVDLDFAPTALIVTVRSSKTTTKRHASIIPIYRASDPEACPVLATR